VVNYQPPQPSADHEWNAESKRCPPPRNRRSPPAPPPPRIAALEASQTTWLRRHALGDPAAIAHLREIDDEIAALER
jgi:hypothetical protein